MLFLLLFHQCYLLNSFFSYISLLPSTPPSFFDPSLTYPLPPSESFCNLDIPAINVELDGILEVAYGALHRHSVVMAAVALEASGRAEPEEDSESTAL